MGEGQVYRQQSLTHAGGGPAPDLGQMTAWRSTAHPSNIELLNFYARYLTNQYQGMGQALSLDSVRAALDIEEVRREAWAPMTQRLLMLHHIVVRHLPKNRGTTGGSRRNTGALKG